MRFNIKNIFFSALFGSQALSFAALCTPVSPSSSSTARLTLVAPGRHLQRHLVQLLLMAGVGGGFAFRSTFWQTAAGHKARERKKKEQNCMHAQEDWAMKEQERKRASSTYPTNSERRESSRKPIKRGNEMSHLASIVISTSWLVVTVVHCCCWLVNADW